jgi:phosphopantetheinyl transferase
LDPDLIRVDLGTEQVDTCLLELGRLSDLESTAVRFLTAPERAEYAELRLPLRRREWLGARVCLKLMALRAGVVDDPLACAIAKDLRGRPRLVRAPALVHDVVADCSLSHKGRFACGAVSRTPGVSIGIDVEEVSERLSGLARAFVNGRDVSLGSQPEPERLAVLWALKEACSKVVGRGLALPLRDVVCEETSPGRHRVVTAGVELAGHHVLYDGYVVALCVGAGGPPAS